MNRVTFYFILEQLYVVDNFAKGILICVAFQISLIKKKSSERLRKTKLVIFFDPPNFFPFSHRENGNRRCKFNRANFWQNLIVHFCTTATKEKQNASVARCIKIKKDYYSRVEKLLQLV